MPRLRARRNALKEATFLADTDESQMANDLSLPVTNYMGLQISVDLYVGGQLMPMIFDTGSSWFWVQSDYCMECL